MSVSSCPFDVIPAEDLWSPHAQESLHTVNTCPDDRRDLLFGWGYANEQMQTPSLSFHSFLVILSCLCLLSCLSLPSSASEPGMTLAQFPAFLFLFLSSCYAPSQSLFLLTVYTVTLSTFRYYHIWNVLLKMLVACCGGTTALFLPGLDNCSQPLLELKHKLTAFDTSKQHFR